MLCVCIHVCVCPWRPVNGSYPLELDLQAVASHSMWELRTKLGSLSEWQLLFATEPQKWRLGTTFPSSPLLLPSLSLASFLSHKAPVRRGPAWPLTDSSSLPLCFPNTHFTDYIFYQLGNSNRNGFKWQGLEIVTVFLQERVTNFTSASELIKTFWSTIILDTLSLKLGLLS